MTKVGLAYDLIKLEDMQGIPLDSIAEFDSEATIQAIVQALSSWGHEVILLEAGDDFLSRLNDAQPDIVFNIAEGKHGEDREALVPAMCELSDIPYTGSGVRSLSICLNKARTNEVLLSHGLDVPPFQVFASPVDALSLDSEFPLIVKLLHEGSSMGLNQKSVVQDEMTLREQAGFIINTYHQPVLVQKYIPGREFNVGILGNQEPFTLPITEITFQDPLGIVMFCPDDDVLPMLRQARGERFVADLLSQVIPKKTICPADVSPELAQRINQTAIKAYQALECRDWCRVDFRLSNDDRLYILELNPIAGIAPGYWLPNSAEVVDISYDKFINLILNIAMERVGIDNKLKA